MGLTRSFLRFLRRNKKVAAKRNKIYFEQLEPRILLDAMTYMAPTGGIDGTLRLQNVGGVDTLQLIKNSDQSVLVSQALADTSSVVITGSGDWDSFVVDFSNPFSTPVTFKDSSDTDSDTLSVINSANRTWNLTGPNSGNVAGIQFEGIENFSGTDLGNQFIFGDGWGAVSVINAGMGNDVLDFSNVSADLTFFIYDHGTVAVTDGTNTLQETAGIEMIKGGKGNNSFLFDDGGSFAGSIQGGTSGTNTLDYSAYTTGVAVDLLAGTATGTTGVIGIQKVIGGSATDNLTGDAQANKLTGGGGNDTLSGGAGDDTYVLMPDSGTDTIVENTGSDTLDYSAYTTGVTVDLGAGTAPGITGVTGTENVIGGSGADTLTGNAGANILAGGAGDDVYILKVNSSTDTFVEEADEGSDTLDYSAFTAAITVDLAAGTATGLTAGFDNLENVIGGSGADTLTGDESANVLTGGRGNDTLTGGAGHDTYILTSDAGTKTIVENPDEGFDTLDYSAFTKAVTVDLTTGTATGLTAGFANVENVIGGSGKDTIEGNSLDNVLTGGPGADTLIGGGGTDTVLETRDANFTVTNTTLVIGSEGTDTLSEVEGVHFVGGAGDNHFDASAFTDGSIWLEGGGGNDTYTPGVVIGTFRIVEEDNLTISSNLLVMGDIELISGGVITVSPGVTISTRRISGEDQLLSPSTGDSGNISFEAKTISIGSGARLLSHVEDGSSYISGDIVLKAYEATGFSGLLVLTVDDADTKIEMQNATIKGGNVTISASSDSARNANDDSPGTITTPEMFQESGLEQFGESAVDFLTTLSIFAGVALSNASAEILVGGNSVIEATNLTMFAGSQTEATVSTITAILGVAVGVSNSDAHITVENGARITTTNDLSIKSFAGDEMSVKAMQHYALPSDGPEKVNLCLAIGVSDVESTAVIESGATVEAGGNLSVEALMDRSINISASAIAYEDGMFGTGIAISYADADATAAIDGAAHATGDVLVRTDSQTDKDDISAKSGAGTGLIGGLIFKIEKGALNKFLPDKFHLNKIDTWYRRAFGGLLDAFSGTTTSLALSAAFSFADQFNDATARIGDLAVVGSDNGSVDVHSSILLMPETSATSWIDSQKMDEPSRPRGNTKENSFSGAMVLGFFHNTANATIGAGVVVDAGGEVSVLAENRTPYDIQWFQLSSFSDITDKMNSNFGVQNGIFTSWAQSNAQGQKTAIAGSVNVFDLENHTNAIIYENAKITVGGAVLVQAKTEVDAVHMSGVFGVKGFVFFPSGSQAGEGGVGGSYLQVIYDDHTNALIKTGAEVTAETLVLYADTITRNISIAESGGVADKYGVNGSVSVLVTDNNTLAQIDDGATVTTGSNAVRLAKDIRDRLGDDNFKLLGITGDIDWLIENVPLVLDSNLDGVVNANDDDIDYVDPGADADSPNDDAYVLKENQFIAAEDESQIFNFGGGIVKGRNVGIGASVAINDIDRDTRALVGNRKERVSQRDFNPASGVDSTDSVNLGYTHGYMDGDAVLYTSGDGTPIGGLTSGGRYYVDSVDGTIVRLARSAAEATNAPSTYFTPAAVNGIAGVETIHLGYTHGFQLGDALVYHNGGGASIGGLVDGQTYYVIPVDSTTIALASSLDEALAESRNLFRAQDAVDADKDTIDFGNNHGLTTGQAVVYRNGGGAGIGGLTNGAVYYAVVQDDTVIKLAATHANAVAATPVTLDLSLPATADGSLHSLHPAFNPATAVDSAVDTIDFGYEHDFVTGDPIVYSANGGTPIGGLTSGGRYYVIVVNAETIALANSEADAAMAEPRPFTPVSDVDNDNDTIDLLFHGFQTGNAVVYENETGTDIGGLTNGAVYYIVRVDENTVKLAPTLNDAQKGTNLINLDASAASGTHWLRGNTRINLNASSSTGDSHTVRPDLRVDLNSATATGTAHNIRLALDPSSATGLVHAIGRVFDPATSVNRATEAINLGYTHGFTTGQAIAYSCGYGDPIGGIGEGQIYYAVVVDATTIKLATSEADALAGKVIDLDPSEAEGPAHAIGAVIPAIPGVDGTTGTIDLGVHHGYTTGQALTYHTGGGQPIGGLLDGQTYYAVVVSDTAIHLAATEEAAKADIPVVIDLDPTTAAGSNHSFSDPDDLTGSVSSGGDVAVLALNDGQIITATLAASVLNDHATGQIFGAAKDPYTKGKHGIAVSGDVSVNIITDETEASIKDAAVAMASNLDVEARTTDDIYAGAGSVSISWKDKNSVGIAGSFVNNILDNETSAYIDNSTVNITGDLDVAALTTGDIIGIAAGGSGSPKGVGISGSVSVNVISQDTFGYVQESDIKSVHDVTLAATSSSEITGVAGAVSFGGKVGVGLSVSVDVITNDTKAYAETSDINAAGGISITAASGAEGQNIPSIFDPATGVDGDMNLITFSAPSRLGYGEEVTYDNEGSQSIGGLRDGATYSVIVLDDDTIGLAASSDDAKRAQKQFDTFLDVDDSSNSIYLGPDHGLKTGDAVYYRDAADYQDTGSSPNGDIGLAHGTFYYAIVEGDRIKLATTNANASAGVSVDLHPYYKQNPDDPDAKIGVRQVFLIQKEFVDLAPGSGTGERQSLQVWNHDIVGTAAAPAISVSAKARMAGAASVTVNTITNDTYAGISGKKVQGLVSGADVLVSAVDSTEINAVAGAVDIVAGMGEEAGPVGGFGASVAYNSIEGPVKATIADSTVESAGKVDLTALSDGTIEAVAAAGSVSGDIGWNRVLSISGVGAGAGNTVTHATEAEITGSTVTTRNRGAVTLTATDETSIEANAIGGSIAASATLSTMGGALAIGVSVAVNHIDNTVRAALENSILGQIGDLTITASEDGTIQALSVAATLSFEAGSKTSLAFSGGGAEATNYIGPDVAAYVSHTDIPGAGNITIGASDGATVTATIVAATAAGNISPTGGWGAGIGVSVARNFIGWSPDTSTHYQWSTDAGLAQGQTLLTGNRVLISSGARAGDIYEYLGTSCTQPTAMYTATNAGQTVTLQKGTIVAIAPDFSGKANAGSLYKYVGTGATLNLPSVNYLGADWEEVRIDLRSEDYSDADVWKQVNLGKTPARIQAYTQDSAIAASGALAITARDAQTIDAVVAAAALALSGGGRSGVGVSGAGVGVGNHITSDIDAYIDGDGATGVSAGTITITAGDASGIDAVAGAGALAGGFGGTAGVAIPIGVSVAINEIDNDVQAFIRDADTGVTTTAGAVTIKASSTGWPSFAMDFAGRVTVSDLDDAATQDQDDPNTQTINEAAQDAADDQVILEALRNTFTAHGVSLSGTLSLTALTAGSRWLLVNEYGDSYVLEAVSGKLQVSETSITAVSTSASLAASIGLTAGVSVSGAGAGAGNTILSDTHAFLENSRVTSTAGVDLDAASTLIIAATVVAPSLSLGFGTAGVGASIGVASAHNRVGLEGDGAVKAFLLDSTVNATGDLSLHALGDQDISSTVAAACGVVAIGATGAGGLTGSIAVANNEIGTDVNAYIDGDGTGIRAGGIAINASDTSTISAVAIAPSLSAVLGYTTAGVSVAIGAGVAHNTISGTVAASVTDAVNRLESVLGNIALTASGSASITAVAVAPSLSAGGGFVGVALGGGGADARNVILTKVESSISGSKVISAADVSLLAEETASIVAKVAGAGASIAGGLGAFGASIGTSTADNLIGYKDDKDKTRSPAEVCAWISGSDVNARDISVKATANSTVDALLVAISAALSGGFSGIAASGAGVGLDNKVAMQVNAYIEGELSNGIDARGNVTVTAEDTSMITARGWAVTLAASAGAYTASVAVGVAMADNLITSDVEAWLRSTTVSADGDLSVLANENATIDASAQAAAVAAAFSIGTSPSGGGAKTSVTVDTTTKAYIDSSTVTLGGDLTVTAENPTTAHAEVGATSVAAALVAVATAGAVSTATTSPTVSAALGNGSQVTASGSVSFSATATPVVTANVSGIAGSLGLSVAESRAQGTAAPNVKAFLDSGSAVTADQGSVTILAQVTDLSVDTQAQASGGGILLTVDGAKADSTASPVVNAYLGAGTTVQAGQDVSIISASSGTTNATADGVSVDFLVAAGVNTADAIVDEAETQSYADTGAHITAGNDITIIATSSQNSYADASAIAGAAGAGASTEATAKRIAPVVAKAGDQTTLVAGHDVTISANNSTNQVYAKAQNTVGGIVGAGLPTSTATITDSTTAALGNSATVTAASGSFTIQAVTNDTGVKSKSEAQAYAGIAVAVGDADTNIRDPATVQVGSGAQVTSGMNILVEAIEGFSGSSTADTTAGGLGAATKATADVTGTLGAFTYIGSGASLIAGAKLELNALIGQAGADALATTDAAGGGVGANSQANIDLDIDATVTAHSVKLDAPHVEVTAANRGLDTYAHSNAIAKAAGVDIYSTAYNYVDKTAKIDLTGLIVTRDLWFTADTLGDTRADADADWDYGDYSSGVLIWGEETHVNRTTQILTSLTVTCGIEHRLDLAVDQDGNISSDGIPYHVDPVTRDIVVDNFIYNNPTGWPPQARFFVNGPDKIDNSVVGNVGFFNYGAYEAHIINESDRTLDLGAINAWPGENSEWNVQVIGPNQDFDSTDYTAKTSPNLLEVRSVGDIRLGGPIDMPDLAGEVTISSEGDITGPANIRAAQINLEAGGDIGSAGSRLVLAPIDLGLSVVAGESMVLQVNPIFSTDGGTMEVKTLQAGGDIDVLISSAVLNNEERTPAETRIEFSGAVSAGGNITMQVLADVGKGGRIDLKDSVTAGGNVSIDTVGFNVDVFVWDDVTAGGPTGTVYLETGGSIHLWLASRITAPGDATLSAGGVIQSSSTALIIADDLKLLAIDTVGAFPGSLVTVNLTGILTAIGNNGVNVQNQGGVLTVGCLFSPEGGASLSVRDTAGSSDLIMLTSGATVDAKTDLRLASGDGISLPDGVVLSAGGSLTLAIDAGANDPDTGPGMVLDFTTAHFFSPVIRIQTGSDDDVIRVNDLPEEGSILDISTGGGDDQLRLGDTSHILSWLSGTILFDGGTGSDSVSVDNSKAGVAGTGTLWLDSASKMAYRDAVIPLIRMTGMGDLWYLGVEDIDIRPALADENVVDIDGTGDEVETVDIVGTSGREVFRVGAGLDRLLSGVHGLISLDGGAAGLDTLSIVENNYQPGVSFTEDRLTATTFTGQGMDGGIQWANISTLSLSLLGNTDLTITAAPLAATTVLMGPGTEDHSVRIGEGHLGDAAGRAAFPASRSLSVTASGSNYTMVLDDRLDADLYTALLNTSGFSINNGLWSLFSGFSKNRVLLGTGGGMVYVQGAPSGLKLATIVGGQGSDNINVSAFPAGTVLDVQGGAGDDRLKIEGTAALQATVASVIFQGGEGHDTIWISALDAEAPIPALFLDQPATNPWPYMGSTFAAIRGLGMTNGVYYDAENIEITLTNQVDTAYVKATTEGTESITIYGGEGNDQFYLGGSDALTKIHGNLNLWGGNDTDDRMWIDNHDTNIDFDTGDGIDSVIGLGAFTGQGLEDTLTYSGFEELGFYLGSGKDSIAIDFAQGGSTLVVNTGAGDDRLSVGYEHGLGSLYADLIGLAGGDGIDQLVFSNAGDYTNKDNIYISGGNIQNLTTEGGQIAIPDGSGFETMGITLGGGHNTVEVEDPTAPLTIRGTNGSVDVTVTSMQSGQTLDFYGGSAADHLYVGDTTSTKIVSGAVKFYGGGGDDVAYVYELASQGTVWFEGGGGNDELQPYRFFTYTGGASGYTTDFVDGAVLFFGDEGTDGIVIWQTLVQANSNTVTFDCTAAPGYGLEMGHVGGLEMAQGVWYDAENLSIQLQGSSTSADRVYIDATAEGVETLTVVGGSYEDQFYVGQATGSSLSRIHGNLTLNGGGGYQDKLYIDNADDTTGWSDIALTSTGFTGMGLNGSIAFAGFAWVTLTVGDGADEVWLESIPYVNFPVGYGRDHSYATINDLGTDDTVFMSPQVADMVLPGYWKVDGDVTPIGIKVDSPQTGTQPQLPSSAVTVINGQNYPVLASQGTVTYSTSNGLRWYATSSVDQDVVVYVQLGYWGSGLRFAAMLDVEITNIPPVVTLPDRTIDEGGTPTFTITDPGMSAGETYTCYWQIADNATGETTTSDPFPWNSQPPFPAAAGNYDVTLFVTDSEVTRSASATIKVNNVAPAVDAGPDVEGELREVELNGSVTDPGSAAGETVTSHWVITDTKSTVVAESNELNWTFQAPAFGIYTAMLTATDEYGLTASDSAVLTLANRSPTVDAGPDTAVEPGHPVTLTGSFTDPGQTEGETYDTMWTVYNSAGLPVAAKQGSTLTFTTHTAGVYPVTFSVTDEHGGVGTDTLAITVAPVMPVVNAGPDVSIDLNGSPVTLTGSFTDPAAEPNEAYTIGWTITNSSGVQVAAGKGLSLTYTPAAAGTYTATLSVTDSDGNSGTDSLTITASSTHFVFQAGSQIVKYLENGIADTGTVNLITFGYPDYNIQWGPGTTNVTATIDWGDGTTSAGTITQTGVWQQINGIMIYRVFSVQGSHPYTEDSYSQLNQVFPVSVTITRPARAGYWPQYTAIVTTSASINTHAPVITDVTFPDPANVGEPANLTVNFGDGSDWTYGRELGVSWNEGESWQYYDMTNSQRSITVSHTYAKTGSGTLQLQVLRHEGENTGDSSSIVTREFQVAAVPAVEAGADVTVQEGQSVTLSGTVRNLSNSTAQWQVIDVFSRVVAATGSGTTFAFTPPDASRYKAIFTAVSGSTTLSDALLISVTNVAPIVSAVAVINEDFSAADLIGSFSDPGQAQGELYGVLWQVYDRSTNALVASAETANFHFVCPSLNTTYRAVFTVTDDEGASGNVTLQRGLLGVPRNTAPVAEAGSGYQVDEGGIVTLDGTGSFDAQQRTDSLAYAWDLDADGIFGETGADALRGDETGMRPTFSAALLDGPSVWTVRLRVEDDYGETSEDTTTITILNVAPVAVNDAAGTLMGMPVTVEVLANDSDVGGDILSINSFTQPGHGNVTDNGDGTLLYTPSSKFVGSDSFTYAVSDGNGGSSQASVALTVMPLELAISAARQAGDYMPDTFRLVKKGDGIEVSVNGKVVFTTPFATAPLLKFTGSKDVDTLIVDFSAGNPIFFRGISFDGKAVGKTDTLILTGGSASTETYAFTGERSGTVGIDGSILSYTAVGVITDTLHTANRSFLFGSSNDTIILGDGGVPNNGISRITGAGNTVNFSNPTDALMVGAGAGNDTISLLANTGPATLNAGAGADAISVRTISFATIINGGTEDDSIIVGRDSSQLAGSLNAIAARLTVNGEAGSDTLYVDDGLDTIANAGDLTATTLTGLGMGTGITYGTMEMLKINLGSGGDTFTIQSTHAGTTALYTNAGNDTITYPASNPTIYIDLGSGSDTINGLPGGGLLGAIHQEIFGAESGTWTVDSGSFEFEPEFPGGDTLGVFHIARYIPNYFEVTATLRAEKPIAGSKANAYLVFDYQSATDFKFAGLNVSTNKLQIGYRDATGWHVVAHRRYTGSLKSDTDYDVLLSINGSTATLMVEDRGTLMHTFPTRVDEDGVIHFLNGGMVGLGAHDAKGRITNVAGHLPPITLDRRVDFSSDPTDLLEAPSSGTWNLTDGRYSGTPVSGKTAIDLLTLDVAPTSFVQMSATLAAETQSGFSFDYYGPNKFKFVTLSVKTNQILLGHRTVEAGWVIDAALKTPSLDSTTDYTLSLTLKGSTVSVTLNDQPGLSYSYRAPVTDGRFGLFARKGQASFTEIDVKTDDPAFTQPSLGERSSKYSDKEGQIQESRTNLVSMDMSAETPTSTITSKQSAWLSDYLLNAGEKNQDGFGVNDDIQIKIIDKEEEGIYNNRTLGKVYSRRS